MQSDSILDSQEYFLYINFEESDYYALWVQAITLKGVHK